MVNPGLLTLPSAAQAMVLLDATATLFSVVVVPEYATPLTVMVSKFRSVWNSNTSSVVARSTLNAQLSLLPWLPAPSVMHCPPSKRVQAPVGVTAPSEKAGGA
jgi:hypothetical protein